MCIVRTVTVLLCYWDKHGSVQRTLEESLHACSVPRPILAPPPWHCVTVSAGVQVLGVMSLLSPKTITILWLLGSLLWAASVDTILDANWKDNTSLYRTTELVSTDNIQTSCSLSILISVTESKVSQNLSQILSKDGCQCCVGLTWRKAKQVFRYLHQESRIFHAFWRKI